MGMEFKDKIMLHCFRKVKRKQGFTTGLWYYLYNALGLTGSMCISVLLVSESECRYSNPLSIPERWGYEFTFQFFEYSNEEIMAME